MTDNEPSAPGPPEPDTPTDANATVAGSTELAVTRTPAQQMGDLPVDELEAIAEEFGLDARKFHGREGLVSAIHARRQLIASLDKRAMRDVLLWAGRQTTTGVSLEQMAVEIVQIRGMRFNGLSERGLVILALLRGCDLRGSENRDDIIRELKKQEGFFKKFKRKTRGWVGRRIERMLGDSTTQAPPVAGEPPVNPTVGGAPRPPVAEAPRQQALREEIEESGFFGGIANRVKRQADSYVNQKLDEIESRIDRKLDEIDRRLAEWRDKEIASRIRILKITLWASVVVAAISLIYSYVKVEAHRWNLPQDIVPSTTHTQKVDRPSTTDGSDTSTATLTSRSCAT